MIQLRHLILSGATVSTVSSVSCKFFTASVVRHIIPLPTLFLASVFYSDISSVDRIVSDSLMIPWWFVSGYATHYLPITYSLPTHCLPQQPLTPKKNRFPGGDFFFLGCFGQFWTKKNKIFFNF